MADQVVLTPLERAIAALRAAGYVVVPDPAGFLRVRRRRSAHI